MKTEAADASKMLVNIYQTTSYLFIFTAITTSNLMSVKVVFFDPSDYEHIQPQACEGCTVPATSQFCKCQKSFLVIIKLLAVQTPCVGGQRNTKASSCYID
jgi:hypothetical protein